MLLTSSRLPLLLAAVAGLAMITVTAWQGYRFWQHETSGASVTASSGNTQTSADVPREPDVDLASLDLFGKPGATNSQTEPDTENLPETNLQLFLRGVLAASGEFPGSALIEDDKSRTEAYLVGDELPGNATLRSVRANRVIIERGGKLENLYFPDDEDRSGVSLASSQTSQDAEEPDQPGAQQTTTGQSSSSASQDSEQRREEIRRRLEQLRERLRNNN